MLMAHRGAPTEVPELWHELDDLSNDDTTARLNTAYPMAQSSVRARWVRCDYTRFEPVTFGGAVPTRRRSSRMRLPSRSQPHLYLSALCALFWAPSLFAQATGTISGTVVDRGNRRPLQGVQVTIAGTGATVGTTSNARGTLRIVNVSAGPRTF